MFKNRFNTNCYKYYFSNRIVDEWNLLTDDVASRNTVNGFKVKLDQHLRFSRGLYKLRLPVPS